MVQYFSPRSRKVKILATLGPASANPDMIRKLFVAGADAFRRRILVLGAGARAARLRATVVQCCAQTVDAVFAALRGEG